MARRAIPPELQCQANWKCRTVKDCRNKLTCPLYNWGKANTDLISAVASSRPTESD